MNKFIKSLTMLLVVVATFSMAACGGTNHSYWLTFLFPDQDAISAADTIEFYIIEPGEGSTCTALLDATAEPFDDAYPVTVSKVVDFSKIQDKPEVVLGEGGEYIFFARVKDSEADVYLRGCSKFTVGDETEVSIVLQYTPDD